MDNEERLISLWQQYQANRDSYTPEQQAAMDEKFGALAQKAKEEQTPEPDTKTVPESQMKSPVNRYRKPADETVVPKQYRVTL